jgi:hypothetical protein
MLGGIHRTRTLGDDMVMFIIGEQLDRLRVSFYSSNTFSKSLSGLRRLSYPVVVFEKEMNED